MPQSHTSVVRRNQLISLPRCLAISSAAALTIASAVTNISAAIAKHPDLTGKFVSGLVAGAVSILVTLSIAAGLQALSKRNYGLALVAFLAFWIAASSSIVSALGVLGGPRLSAGAVSRHSEATMARAVEARQNASNAILALSPSRSASEVQAAIDAKLSSRRDLDAGAGPCVGWLPNSSARGACIEVSTLRAELAVAAERSRLVQIVSSADAVLDAKPVINPTSDAIVLAAFLAALGFTVAPDVLNLIIIGLGTVILECGAGFSLAIAQAFPAPIVSRLQETNSISAAETQHPTSKPANPGFTDAGTFLRAEDKPSKQDTRMQGSPALQYATALRVQHGPQLADTPLAQDTARAPLPASLTAALANPRSPLVQSAVQAVPAGFMVVPATVKSRVQAALLDAVQSGSPVPSSIRRLHAQIRIGSHGTMQSVVSELVASGTLARAGDQLVLAGAP